MSITTPYITRTVDDLGRIVIPKEIRHNKGILTGDALGIIPVKEGILLVPSVANSSIKEQVSRLKDVISDNYSVTCDSDYNAKEAIIKRIGEIQNILEGKPIKEAESIECIDF